MQVEIIYIYIYIIKIKKKSGFECVSNSECSDTTFCSLLTNSCSDPCTSYPCGPNSVSRAVGHSCQCECETGFAVVANVGCSKYLSIPSYYGTTVVGEQGRVCVRSWSCRAPGGGAWPAVSRILPKAVRRWRLLSSLTIPQLLFTERWRIAISHTLY